MNQCRSINQCGKVWIHFRFEKLLCGNRRNQNATNNRQKGAEQISDFGSYGTKPPRVKSFLVLYLLDSDNSDSAIDCISLCTLELAVSLTPTQTIIVV